MTGKTARARRFGLGCLLFATISSPVHATEGGVTAWPAGINTVFPGVNPDVGSTMFYNYNAYYTAPKITDGRGRSAIPGASVDVLVSAFRFLHTWGGGLGPFTITSGGAVTVLHNSTDLGAFGKGSVGGVQNVLLEPIYLNYATSGKSLFVNFGTLFDFSTGSYDQARTVNLGTNTWSISPILNITWFASQTLNFSLSGVVDTYSRNRASGYQSGPTLTIDYAVMSTPIPSLPKWSIGIQGYYSKQISDDKIYGHIFNDGNRLARLAIGPQLLYLFAPDRGIVIKWDHEVLAKNTSKGDKIWVQFAFPLSGG